MESLLSYFAIIKNKNWIFFNALLETSFYSFEYKSCYVFPFSENRYTFWTIRETWKCSTWYQSNGSNNIWTSTSKFFLFVDSCMDEIWVEIKGLFTFYFHIIIICCFSNLFKVFPITCNFITVFITCSQTFMKFKPINLFYLSFIQ